MPNTRIQNPLALRRKSPRSTDLGANLQLAQVRDGPLRLHPAGARAAESLRADEYVGRQGWIPATMLNPYGGETDHFDDRASHFAVLTDPPGDAVVAVATVRLVRDQNGDLPIAAIFPETPGQLSNSLEVSRYIARKPSAALAIRAVVVAELLRSGRPGVAVISVGLRKLLGRQSLVLRDLAEPRVVPVYGSRPQVAVAINAAESASMPRMADLVDRGLARDWNGVMNGAIDATR